MLLSMSPHHFPTSCGMLAECRMDKKMAILLVGFPAREEKRIVSHKVYCAASAAAMAFCASGAITS